jgi:hypothetical protein
MTTYGNDQNLPGTENVRRALPTETTTALDEMSHASKLLGANMRQLASGEWHNESGVLDDALRGLGGVRWHADEATAALVTRARSLDLSWQWIGDALGMTRQAAQQRYGR